MSEIIEGEATEIPEGEQQELAQAFEKMDGAKEPPPGSGQAPGEAPQITIKEELAGILFTAGQILGMKYPSLVKVFSMEKCDEVAGNISPLFEYYGWKILGGVVGLWLNALTALVMLAMEVRFAIQADIADAIRQAHEAATQTQQP